MNPNGQITSELDGGVLTLTFGHPAHNSMPSSLLRRTVKTLDVAAKEANVRAILLRSAGDRTFCAGANFDELLAIDNFDSGQKFFMGFANLLLAMRRCPKPIVVAVQGKAIGGGVGIAAAADYCLATEAASIKLSELAIAIGPFVILPALVRKMGTAAATELSIDTEWHDAAWAKGQGLYQRVYSDQAAMMGAAQTLCHELAGYSSAASAHLKATLWAGTENWPDLLAERAGVSGNLILGTEAKEALKKFKNRSKPSA